MKIVEIRSLRGPNLYADRPVIIMEIDLEDLENTPSDLVPGIRENLINMLPSIYEHTCSPGVPGGFLQRIQRGTWAGHVAEHIAIELQCLIGHEVSFGKTFTRKEKGMYTVVFRYKSEAVGIRAGQLAMEITEDLFRGKITDIAPIIEELRKVEENNELGPSTRSIVKEAALRGISHIRLNDHSYVQLGQGKYQRRLEATILDSTSFIGVEIASDKFRTKTILQSHGIPVPKGFLVSSEKELNETLDKIDFPVVVKPLDGNHGRGITTLIKRKEELIEAFKIAKEISSYVIVEKQLEGKDFRIMVINGKMEAAALREPASILGDGVSTIKELIEKTNEDPLRGEGHERILTKITIDKETIRTLSLSSLTLESILDLDEKVYVKSTANLSSGGTARDVTDEIHPYNIALFERCSKIIGLDIMGIDVVAKDLSEPLDKNSEGIVEVNAAPGFRMHLNPSSGTPRNIAAPVVDLLFPKDTPYSIPICAVTGTNGKTTTVRLINHIMRENGSSVGMSSTDGVEINGNMILKGDYSGPLGAESVIKDPTVDLAVFEVARGGILRRGLGFNKCSVGVLLNVTSDHLGYGSIENLNDLSLLKSTVTESVVKTGYAVFNADDERVIKIKNRSKGKHVLFSKDINNPHLIENHKKGNINVTIKENRIAILEGPQEILLNFIDRIPLTFSGKASFNIENCLAAVGAAYTLGADPKIIEDALYSFKPSIEQSHGRMNLIEKNGVKAFVDYSHNVASINSSGKFISSICEGKRIRLASGVGNRRDEDIVEYGKSLSLFYDYIVICDASPRGRKPLETAELVKEGLLKNGFKEENIIIVQTEKEGTIKALELAKKGDIVILQADNIDEVIKDTEEFFNREENIIE